MTVGIGGIFFKSRDPAALREWYNDHFDLGATEHGAVFGWRTAGGEEQRTIWSPFDHDTDYFAPSESDWMLNLIVDDLDATLARLKDAGVELSGEPEAYSYGKFGWVLDPEGHKIELWEPLGPAFPATVGQRAAEPPARPEPYVRSAEDADLRRVPRARGTRMAVLIGPDHGAPNFATRRFILEPGGRIPAHKHPDIEHEQYVVRGQMTLGLDDQRITAGQGDTVFIPAGTVHWYENTTDAPCEFLCAVPNTDAYTTEWLEDPPDGAYLPNASEAQ